MLNASYSNLINHILSSQRQAVTDTAQSIVHRKIMDDFQIEKQLLLQDLKGGKTLGGAFSSTQTHHIPSTHHTHSVHSHSTALSPSALQHAAIVSNLPPAHRPHTPYQAVQHLLSILPPSSPDTDTIHQAYANTADLLNVTIHHTSHSNNTPPQRALAALSHLADQYRHHILSKVHHANMAGRFHGQQTLPSGDSASGLATHLALFVNMHLPPPSSPNADHDRATLWATIYY
eukprot:5153629-Ditylum_brightwellii.AAC.1